MTHAFVHAHASHCESGVMSALLRHDGMPMSEAMAFGVASGISFAYLPFIRINGLPLVAFRMPPRAIIKGLRRGLGLDMRFETFRTPAEGTARLDQLLDAGKLVGMQASIFWLPYIPEGMRFHFNAHNLLAYGREGDEYLISDPVAETAVRCARKDLEKARFAKGVFAPRGLLYYAASAPLASDWARLGRRALARTAHIMLHTPFPLIGAGGIAWLGRSIARLPLADGGASARHYIGQIVRMQEEIGTGGAGFRFMYATYLQELATVTGHAPLHRMSERLVAIGDTWQEFAVACSRMIKRRDPLEPPLLGERLREISANEKVFFQDLLRLQRAWQC